jgi:NAD+ synthase
MEALTELNIDFEQESDRISSFISDFTKGCGASGVVIGLSGGLDSSVTAALCVKALSSKGVSALLLPERDSSPESVQDARLHAEKLGIGYRVQDLTEALKQLGCYERGASSVGRFKGGAGAAVRLFPGLARKGFLANLGGDGGRQFHEFMAYFRIKHRLRMVALYREAEEKGLVVASCANRTEFETGFFVRYGDDAGDIAPIKHLYKMQVFGMGKFLGVPESILGKRPSPDLFAGMKDEDIMGISYEELDRILWGLSNGLRTDQIEHKLKIKRQLIDYVMEIRSRSRRLRAGPASLLAEQVE